MPMPMPTTHPDQAGPLYELANVSKTFVGPSETLTILADVNLSVAPGETIAILGASGSGKSTLLHLMGGLDEVSGGSIRFAGRELTTQTARQAAAFRASQVGFVFQFHHLLPEFSALENAAMPARIAGKSRGEALALAREALTLVGLSHRLDHKVTTLSGGERQRVAIARAVLLKPRAVLADEPTGNLDEASGADAANLLLSLNRELGTALVVVTHNNELAGLMHRRLELRSGELHGC